MYITLTKKKLFVILCTFCIVFFILAYCFSASASGVDLSTNDKRIQYIKTLGVTLVSDNYISKAVVIPMEFGAVYSKYNALQKEIGYDLSKYKGKEVTVYTYTCKGDTVVNLIIFKGKLIGGDISNTRLGGSMTALKGVNNG